MTNPSGGGPPFWSPDTDETLHAYNQFSWEICIDPIATETECDQLWPENSSLEYDFPQSTSDLSENSTRCQSGTTYNEALIYGDFFGAEVLDPLTLHPWDNLNCSLSLPDWDNLEDMASIPLQDNFSGSFLLPSSSEDSIEQTFQTISPELADIGAPWNPFRAIFNHGETQPYEAYSLFSNTRLPILENSSLNTTPTTNSMSSPTQSLTTDTTNSISQSTSSSTSNSTTPSSDQSASNTPPSAQNEYNCTICSKIFSKRFEFNKHTSLHTLPHTCPLCPHRTARKRDMTRHITAQHKDVGLSEQELMEKPICRVQDCGRVFARKDHLIRHLRRKHFVD